MAQINNLAKAITALERAEMEKIHANVRLQKIEAAFASLVLVGVLLWVVLW